MAWMRSGVRSPSTPQDSPFPLRAGRLAGVQSGRAASERAGGLDRRLRGRAHGSRRSPPRGGGRGERTRDLSVTSPFASSRVHTPTDEAGRPCLPPKQVERECRFERTIGANRFSIEWETCVRRSGSTLVRRRYCPIRNWRNTQYRLRPLPSSDALPISEQRPNRGRDRLPSSIVHTLSLVSSIGRCWRYTNSGVSFLRALVSKQFT